MKTPAISSAACARRQRVRARVRQLAAFCCTKINYAFYSIILPLDNRYKPDLPKTQE